MPALSIDPELATVTATFTLLNGHPFTSTFAITTGISGAITLPFTIGFPGDGCNDGSTSQSPHRFDARPPGLLSPPNNSPDSKKKGNPACHTDASGGPIPAPTPSQTETPTPSIRPPPISTQTQTSHSADGSGSASVGVSTSTSSQSSRSTRSSNAQSTTGSTSTTATIAGSFPGSSLSSSSDSTVPVHVGNSSTLPAPTRTGSSPATSGPSAGAAVGITLGVLVAAGVLLAASIFLFLHQRAPCRRSRKRDSDSMRQQLTSEDSLRRSLSSTWSWFGSVPIGSEPDPGHRRYRARSRSHDDPSYGPDPEKGASVSINPLAWRAPPSTPPHTQIQLADAISLHIPVNHAPSGLTPPPWSRNPPKLATEGEAQLLALVAKALSASPQPVDTTSNPSREVRHDPEGSWDVVNTCDCRDVVEDQCAHNPFADPRVSRISEGSTVASAKDVMSVEAL